MAKIKLKRLYVPIRLTTPFAGELPVPHEHLGSAYVLCSILVSGIAEMYGRRVIVALGDGKRVVDVGLVKPDPDAIYWDSGMPPSLDEGDVLIRLSRAVLLPPGARVSVYVTGTDGASVAVVLEGLFSNKVERKPS